MTDSLMFVQFPHPGAEHEPTGPTMDWNRGDHARKFLKAPGRYLADGVAREGPVAFWGEWEPQSRVVETFPPEIPGGPRFLHEPFWVSQPDGDRLQNTDPLVFGDRFLYSNCRQRRNRKLRELAPGSIVLFGSKRRSEFVLDTVLVIGDQSQPYMLGDSRHLDCDDWVRSVLFEPLSRGDPPPDPYRLYRGRRYDETPDGPFSFVPCRPFAPGRSAFARPAIRLDSRWIKPNLAMGAKATQADPTELKALWDEVVRQVEMAGLALGVELDPPPRRAGTA